MIPWKYSWNNVRQRPMRTLLTVLSIAGGVAAVIAVLLSAAATRSQLDSLHETLDSAAAMEIVSEDAAAFSPDDVSHVAAEPGVRAVIPVFGVYAKILAGREEVRGLVIGVDLEEYRRIRDFEFIAGRVASDSGEVCLEASAAEHLNVAVGDEIRMGARGIPWLLTKKVVGILQPVGISAVEESASAFLTLGDGAKLGKAAKKISALRIMLDAQAEPETVASRLRSRLPDHLVVAMTASAADMCQPTEDIINIGLNVAALLSLVAAVFIVINTFQISVAERRRQVALLRIVGATTDQIRKSMYLEALVFAAAGTALGILGGITGSVFLAQGVDEIFGFTHETAVIVQFDAILTGFAFGPLITMVSVWYPARTACNTPPLSDLRAATAPQREFPFRNSALIGGVLIVLAVALTLCSLNDVFTRWATILGITSVQIASMLFLPAMIKSGAALLYRPLRRLSMIEARLGEQQLLDNFGRSVLTISVLFLVSAISISIGNTVLLLTNDVRSWIDRTLTADFLLRVSRPRVDMAESQALPVTLDPRLAEVSGIAFIERLSFCVASIEGVSGTLLVREFSGYDSLPVDLLDGNHADVHRKLIEGEIVLGAVLAHRLHASTGDTLWMEISGINHEVRVAGVAKEYTAGGLMIIMDRGAAERLYPIEPAQVYGIRTQRDSTAEAGEKLEQIARELGLIFQSFSDLRELVQGMISGLTARLWMILVLSLVIAAFAIVNTLTINVLEQTRYLGILRVVGMSRFQVFRMFVFQSLVLGLLSLLPALVVGTLIAFLITTLFRGVSEHGVSFSIDLGLFGLYFLCGVLLSIAAAVIPAIRAGRLKPLEAIHEE